MSEFTPAGGIPDATIAVWLDADGNSVEPGPLARTGIIVEYDEDGVELCRTYMEPPDTWHSIPMDLPADQIDVNSYDQIGTWDIRDLETQELVRDMRTLARVLGWKQDDPEEWERISMFCTLPVFKVAPDRLKREIFEWLENNRPS
jgi:hypothetical protein